jgi:hypothetical protein
LRNEKTEKEHSIYYVFKYTATCKNWGRKKTLVSTMKPSDKEGYVGNFIR